MDRTYRTSCVFLLIFLPNRIQDDASAVASSMIECSEKDVPLNTVTMVTKFRL